MHVLLVIMLSGAEAPGNSKVDFDTDIIPVLTKAGCNTGACHGAAAGRGGFRLSLYGSDPTFDYRSIALELEGRRVNLSRPDSSLLLLKATESINHGGGHRLDIDGAGTDLIRKWILDGTLHTRTAKLNEFRVTPRIHVADGIGATVQLKSTAQFSNGSVADVTLWTVFTPEDPMAIDVDAETSQATVLRRGRHIVIARYLDRVLPLEITVPLSDIRIDLKNEPRRNFIDDHILQTLETLRLPVSPPTADSAFLRRITLDLTGRLPTPAQRTDFLSDHNPRKRDLLVDRLLASEEFTEYWTLRFAKLLRIRSQSGDTQGAQVYHTWLKDQIARNVPYDRFTRELLTASGDTFQVGPANFYRTESGPRKLAEFTSELFMGTRLRCANCHNHPLDRWTQDDYHGLAAIFAKVKRGRVIEFSETGEVSHPRTGQAALPRIPGERFLDESDNGPVEIARWLTRPQNPFFAKAAVNRLWKAMMGRGLVEPTDDLRDTNPATHPPLLEELARDFVSHRYNLRHTLRLIARSNTYGRSALPLPENHSDDRYYSHALTRPLEPEVLADAISDVTGVADKYGNLPLGTRAISLFSPNIESETLTVLGQCSRKESCETTEREAGGLTLKLHLLNGPLLNRRIAHPNGRLAKLADSDTPPQEIVNVFYKLALGRALSQQERNFWNQQLGMAKTKQQRRTMLEDFLWSLLTSREFTTNH